MLAFQKEYLEGLTLRLRNRIMEEAHLNTLAGLPPSELKEKIRNLIEAMIAEEKIIIASHDKERIINAIQDETVGFGPLEKLLRDSAITEIMVNGPEEIYIEKEGMISLTNTSFKNNEHIRHIIERIVAPIGRRIDESTPMVDGRLPDGSRVNAVIPPVSIKGPVISIRKFNRDPFTMDDLTGFNTLSEAMAILLRRVVQARLNIIISGGTGSGKTTLLNVLAKSIPTRERIITIEDMAELRLDRHNVVSLEARPPNMEGSGEITIRQLVKNALRMRPDRIVVGEVRGGEALDMLQAMNTGHAGSLTTIHANSPKDALSRLEAMVIMNNPGISVEVVRNYMIGALDLVIQVERLSDGSRKVLAIAEVRKDTGGVLLEEIFRFKRLGVAASGKVQGNFVATGLIPEFLSRVRTLGVELPTEIFTEGR